MWAWYNSLILFNIICSQCLIWHWCPKRMTSASHNPDEYWLFWLFAISNRWIRPLISIFDDIIALKHLQNHCLWVMRAFYKFNYVIKATESDSVWTVHGTKCIINTLDWKMVQCRAHSLTVVFNLSDTVCSWGKDLWFALLIFLVI